MQITLKHKNTLIYYDGPQLFLADDQFNTPYICLLTEQDDNADQFICVPISLTRLEMFYQGLIDLRTIYEAPESDELFAFKVHNDAQETFQLLPLAEIPAEWLPDPDFFFEEEREKGKAVLGRISKPASSSLNPPTHAYRANPLLSVFYKELRL